MNRVIRRIYVTKSGQPQPQISSITTEQQHLSTSRVPVHGSPSLTSTGSVDFHSSSDRYSHSVDNKNYNHDSEKAFLQSDQGNPSQGKSAKSGGAGGLWNLGKWSIPLMIALGTLGAIALAALGLGIYAAVMLSSTSTTTTTAPSSINATVSTTNAPASTTTWNWDPIGSTVAGVNRTSGNTTTLLNFPTDLALDTSNTLYISDSGNNRVEKQSVRAWTSVTVAGQTSGLSGLTATMLSGPNNVLLDSGGNLYITDTRNHRVQFFPNGVTTGVTIAGTAGQSGSSSTLLNTPSGIARDAQSGTIYVADTLNHRIMSYPVGSSTGTVVAGGQGPGLNSLQLDGPTGLYFNSLSNSLIIANTGAHNVVQWTLGNSSWTLLAGDPSGINGSSSTLLNGPLGVTMDSSGNLYVADTDNHRIQFFLSGQSTGTTVAGNSTVSGSSADLLTRPTSVALDTQFNLYVADRKNHRIQRFLKI